MIAGTAAAWVEAITTGRKFEEFRDRLPEVIGSMDTTAVADLLARGLFAAYVAGRAVPGRAEEGA
jgi:phage gp29-like protein